MYSFFFAGRKCTPWVSNRCCLCIPTNFRTALQKKTIKICHMESRLVDLLWQILWKDYISDKLQQQLNVKRKEQSNTIFLWGSQIHFGTSSISKMSSKKETDIAHIVCVTLCSWWVPERGYILLRWLVGVVVSLPTNPKFESCLSYLLAISFSEKWFIHWQQSICGEFVYVNICITICD